MSSREQDDRPGIAVIGMSGRFPGAADLDQLWRNLRDGVESIATFFDEELAEAGVAPTLAADPRYVRAGGALDGIDRFDASFFGFSRREAELLDPQHRLFLETCWRALEDAGCDPGRPPGRIGVFAGAGLPVYLLAHVYPQHGAGGWADTYQAALANDKDFLATRVSYKLDLRGPSLTVQTACSTSLVAVCLACQSLLGRECDAALAGGVTLRLPPAAGYLYQEDGILSPDGHCRAFDAEARGTVPGSGCGVVVLKRLEDAMAAGDVVSAVVRGWAVNNDGAGKAGYTAPRAEGQAEAVLEAMAVAGVDPETVGYVEAHGTGTPLGDPVEVAALSQAFAAAGARRRGFCALGSVKTNLGHLDAAAGVAGLIKTVLALEHRQIPPSLHFTRPNPQIDFAESPFRVAAALADWPANGHPRRAGVSSFGIGGTNAHVVLEEAPPPEPAAEERAAEAAAEGPHLLVLSARTATALDTATADLARDLEERPDLYAADVAFTLQAGRRPLEHRRALICRDLAGAAAALRAADPRRVWTARAEPGHRPVAFLFPGQGSQHAGMAAELYRRLPAFRRELDRCAEVLECRCGLDLPRALFAPEPAVDADSTALAQPALFAVEVALARWWIERGVEPEALLGHSVGEYAAACLAGVFRLDDALALVAERGRLVAELPPGAMLSVPLSEEEVVARLPAGVALAAVNAPGLCAVAGPTAAVEELARQLATEGVETRRLHTSHAFHSPLIEPALAPFRERLAAVPLAPPRIPLLSNVTGTWMSDEEATDPGYWARHLRAPVRFAPAVAELLAEPRRVLLEVGPGDALTSLVRRRPEARERAVVHALPHPQDPASEAETLLAAAARLWLAGVPVEPVALGAGRARKVPLPTYPFERERCWIEASEPAATRPMPAGRVRKEPDLADWFYEPSWKRTPPADALPGIQTEKEEEEERPGWLLLADRAGLGEELAAHLRGRGEPVVTVHAGKSFARLGPEAFALRPDSAEDFEALLAELLVAGPAPGRIVHLWGVVQPGEETGCDPERASRQPVLSGLLSLARALGRKLQGQPVRLAAVSNGLFEVTGGESFAPERAAAAGLARVIPQEHPNLRCRWIDVLPSAGAYGFRDLARDSHQATSRGSADEPGSETREAASGLGFLVEQLAGELASRSAEPLVALRYGRRWVQVFEPVRLTPRAAPLLREGGRYLLAGGLGRFGLLVAEHLARRYRARLTLVDCRSPEEAGCAARLAALREAGAEIEVLRADLAEPAAAGRCVRDAARRWGGLDGVVHAAGAPTEGYKTVAEVTAADLVEHLRPKLGVAVTLVAALDALRREEPDLAAPAFCLAASSLSSVLGGIGLGPFAAADAALDALAESWRSQPGEPAGGPARWIAVNWEGWQPPWEAGEGITIGQQQGELIMAPEEVGEAFERALTLAGEPRLVVATGALAPRRAQWAEVLAAPAVAVPAAGERPGGVPYRAPGNAVEARVAEVWQEVLGAERIGVDDDFFHFGGNSLAGLQILSKLRADFAIELPLKTFFEARTVAGMAAAIAEERRLGDEEERRVAAILAEIEALSADEVAAELAGDREEAP